MKVLFRPPHSMAIYERQTIEELLDFLMELCENEFKAENFLFRQDGYDECLDGISYLITVRPNLYDNLEFVMGYMTFKYDN